jgi:hypothetical protein
MNGSTTGTTEYYLVMDRNEVLTHSTTWTNGGHFVKCKKTDKKRTSIV